MLYIIIIISILLLYRVCGSGSMYGCVKVGVCWGLWKWVYIEVRVSGCMLGGVSGCVEVGYVGGYGSVSILRCVYTCKWVYVGVCVSGCGGGCMHNTIISISSWRYLSGKNNMDDLILMLVKLRKTNYKSERSIWFQFNILCTRGSCLSLNVSSQNENVQ